jgi:hypothetical protein
MNPNDLTLALKERSAAHGSLRGTASPVPDSPAVAGSYEPGGQTSSEDPHGQPTNEDWERYLADLGKPEGPLMADHVEHVRRFWRYLRSFVDKAFPVPQAGPTEARSLVMVWDRDRHHLEVEIFERGIYEWFYRDRLTQEHTGGENLDPTARPRDLMAHLQLFSS